jgi:hypothetical protein
VKYFSMDVIRRFEPQLWRRSGFTVQITNQRKVQVPMADLVVHDSDPPATAAVALTDASGNPTTPDQTPVWTESSDGAILTLAPAADGMSATLTWVAEGTANVNFSVTDDDGTQILATGSVQVGGGEATTATLTFTAGSAPAPAPAPDPNAPPPDPNAPPPDPNAPPTQ